MASSSTLQKLTQYIGIIQSDLDRTVEFWRKYSHDETYGGFFTCLSESGEVYDELKYGWLQGRQVWMYARLYNEVERFHNKDILQEAEKGGEFLMKYIKNPSTWKCYFVVTREGKPVKTQRTIFCECFYLMGVSELAKATGNQLYKDEALGMLDKIEHWVLVDDSDIGNIKLEGQVPTNSLAIPMMVLCVAEQIMVMDSQLTKRVKGLVDWAVEQILAHKQRDGNVVLEHVSVAGKEMAGTQGRLTVPGHVIEAGWFLLQVAQRRHDKELKETALKSFILKPFDFGWDQKHGGLLYFLDVDGHCPTQLEWRQKLWWPHNEAMIAFIMAYQDTHDELYLHKFDQVLKYSYDHFADTKHGEWYGYLNQDGSKNMDFKGGPFKGCFHVPRCLLICEKILKEITGENDTTE